MDDEREGAQQVDLGRREALLKLGKYAAFTAPVVSALLVSEKASAQSCTFIDIDVPPFRVCVNLGGGGDGGTPTP